MNKSHSHTSPFPGRSPDPNSKRLKGKDNYTVTTNCISSATPAKRFLGKDLRAFRWNTQCPTVHALLCSVPPSLTLRLLDPSKASSKRAMYV